MARERIFRFKQFSVVNDKTAMKVGTDGVLLGAWCPLHSSKRVLDVGTGCGVIALIVAQRCKEANIDAIDIDANAIEEASLNFSNSAWGNRLNATLIDFNDFVESHQGEYDTIVSNPPFFTNGILPPDESRNAARHTTSLTFSQLIKGAHQLMSNEGNLMLITPVDAFEEIVEICTFEKLAIKQLTKVHPLKDAPAKRLLWHITNTSTQQQTGSLVIEEKPTVFTDEYRRLCKDLYLKF